MMGNPTWWQAWGAWVAIGLAVVLGGINFIYHDGQSSQQLQNFEDRLIRDEVEYREDISQIRTQLANAEATHRREVTQQLERFRIFELDATTRLATIETDVSYIKALLMEIKEEVAQ